MFYYTCPKCGSNLDFGERCDCEKENLSGGNREAKVMNNAGHKETCVVTNSVSHKLSISHNEEESKMKSENLPSEVLPSAKPPTASDIFPIPSELKVNAEEPPNSKSLPRVCRFVN